MDFVDWLKNQNRRKDDVGWFARLVLSNQPTIDEFRSTVTSGHAPLMRYAHTMPGGKFRTSLLKGAGEFIKESGSEPRIGIFWIIGGEIVDFAEWAMELPIVAGFKNTRYDHVTVWPQVQSLYPELRGKEYNDIPRGRIVGVGVDRYYLFLPPEMISDSGLVRKVMRAFSLPPAKTQVMTDEHYSLDGDPFNDDEIEHDPFDYDPSGGGPKS